MKILHTVEFYHPSMGGAQEVVRRISEGLAGKGHQVTVATTKLTERKTPENNGVKIVEFDAKGNFAYGLAGEIEKYQKFILDGDFDVIMNYAAQQWTFDALIPILDKIETPKIFVPCGFSGLYNPRFKEYFQKMPQWLARYDKLIFLSENYRDINFAKNHNLNNFIIIPNGASQEEFKNNNVDFKKKYKIPQSKFLIITVGGHTGLKGHTLIIRAFSKAKIKNSVLAIIGNNPFGSGCAKKCAILKKIYSLHPNNIANGKEIIILNIPREDTVAAYKSANLFAFGSNVECSPLVLFEAMAAKIPFVTTAAGNAEEIIKWSNGGLLVKGVVGQNGFVNGDLNNMAQKIEYIYNNPDIRATLAQNGYNAWKNRFTFEHIIDQYEQLYLSLLNI